MKEEKRYWNPIIETLPWEKLQEIELKRFRELLRWTEESSPFYKRTLKPTNLTFKDLNVWRRGGREAVKALGSPIKRHLSREKTIPTVRGVSSSPSVVRIGVGETNQ